MTDTSRPIRLDRRAVLGGLLVGTAAASVPVAWVRAKDGDPPSVRSERIEIDARPIAHFERNRPEVKRFGQLEFRGGLVLSSSASDFGGWSALIMEPAGKSLLAISDEGHWLSADLVYDGSRPRGLTRARLGPLLDKDGQLLDRKVEQDAESATLIEGTLQKGTLLIGFERHHRIDRYPIRDGEVQPPTGTPEAAGRSQAHAQQPGHRGPHHSQGRPLQGLGGGLRRALHSRQRLSYGLDLGRRGEPQRFQLKDIDGFNITDAAGLADGSLLVLERYFRWTEGVKMRLRHIPAGEIAPAARITGRTLLEADSSFDIDNMEGLGVHLGAGGETVLSLISDDNFNHFLQRTVFLQFTLHEVD